MADLVRLFSEGVVPENGSASGSRPYCKKCGTTCQESRPYKCLTCQEPSYWACQICKKELLLQSKWEHAKHCTEDKAAKKQIAKAKLAESRKKWKRSASNDSSPVSEDSCSDSEYKKSKLSSDEEYTVSSESEDDCWSPESSPDSSCVRSAQPAKKKLGSKPNAGCTSNYVAKARALYNYEAVRKDDLSFKESDIIYVVNKRPSGWWLGELNGKLGLIPSNYVEELPFDAQAEAKQNRGSAELLVNHSETKEVIRSSLHSGSSKQGKGNTCKTIAEYEELVRLLKMELEQSQLRCRQQEDKLRDLERYKSDSIKELSYIKTVLESSLNFKNEEEAALEGLEALKALF